MPESGAPYHVLSSSTKVKEPGSALLQNPTPACDSVWNLFFRSLRFSLHCTVRSELHRWYLRFRHRLHLHFPVRLHPVGLCQCHAYRESSCILIISCIILSVKFCFFCYIIVAVLILLYLDRRNQLPQCLLAGLCDTCSGRPSERSVLGISSVL